VSKDLNWLVVCAHCGKPMQYSGLKRHYLFKHDWKTLSNGDIDHRSNPMWKQNHEEDSV
jgi:hypothetical protein